MYGKYAWYLYPRKWSLKGVYGSHHAVGWLVGRVVCVKMKLGEQSTSAAFGKIAVKLDTHEQHQVQMFPYTFPVWHSSQVAELCAHGHAVDIIISMLRYQFSLLISVVCLYTYVEWLDRGLLRWSFCWVYMFQFGALIWVKCGDLQLVCMELYTR